MQNTLIADLSKKYGFEGIHIDEITIRYIELLLGLSYGMDTDAIDAYMSGESKNILEIDLRRISTLLEIPFPEGLEGSDLIRTFKEQVYGLREKNLQKNAPDETIFLDKNAPSEKTSKSDHKYPRLTRLLIEEGKSHDISAFKLDIINDAITQGIEEDYLIELIKRGYDEHELQRLVELYQITHESKHTRKHGR